jgi:Obg family GTPase CgtA-like protein
MGVERLLKESGAAPGDEVRIGDIAFDFEPDQVPS